jgi:hypothetical protein
MSATTRLSRAHYARRVSVPDDPALPRLPVLLDPESMAPFLHRSLGRDAPFPDVRAHYLRYKPGKDLVVHYKVGVDGRYDAVAMISARRSLARDAATRESVALARLVDGRSPAAMPLHYDPELDALIQWYPLDLDLPALAEPPTRLLDELGAAGVSLGAVDGDPTMLAYKPRRRAVLRVGEHVVKIYARRERFSAATAGLRVAGRLQGLRTPALEGHLSARLVTVQPLLPGSRPMRAADVAMEAGELLRELQAADAPPGLSVGQSFRQLSAAKASAGLVAAILPDLRGRVEALLRRLAAGVPSIDRLVPSHGDFQALQLLVTRDGLAVIDFDRMCIAPAALDPATYAGHLVFGGRGDLDEASEVLENLLKGYGGRPVGLDWYLATCILGCSPWPFRYLDEHWPERIEGMAAAAEAALDGA